MDREEGERLAALEADVANLKASGGALQATLHELIRSTLADQAAAIRRLVAAHEARQGIWWTVGWVGAVVVILAGLVGWLFEHRIDIIVKP